MGITRGYPFAQYLSESGLSTCRRCKSAHECGCPEHEKSVRYKPDAPSIKDANRSLAESADAVVIDGESLEYLVIYKDSKRMGETSPVMTAEAAARIIMDLLKPYLACRCLVIVFDNRDKSTVGPHREELGLSGKRKRPTVVMDAELAVRPLSNLMRIHPYTQANSQGRRAWRTFLEQYMFDDLDKRNMNPDEPKELLIVGSYHQIRGSPAMVDAIKINTGISIEADTRIIQVLQQMPDVRGPTLVVNKDGDFIVASDIALPQHQPGLGLYWAIGTLQDPILDMTRWYGRNQAECGLLARTHQQLLIWETDYGLGKGTPHFRECLKNLPMLPAVSVKGDLAIIDLKRLQRMTMSLRCMPGVVEHTTRVIFMILYYMGWQPSPYEFGWARGGTYAVPDGLIPADVFTGVSNLATGKIYYQRVLRNYARRLRSVTVHTPSAAAAIDKNGAMTEMLISLDVDKALGHGDSAGLIDDQLSAIREQVVPGASLDVTVKGVKIRIKCESESKQGLVLVCTLAT